MGTTQSGRTRLFCNFFEFAIIDFTLFTSPILAGVQLHAANLWYHAQNKGRRCKKKFTIYFVQGYETVELKMARKRLYVWPHHGNDFLTYSNGFTIWTKCDVMCSWDFWNVFLDGRKLRQKGFIVSFNYNFLLKSHVTQVITSRLLNKIICIIRI